MPTRKGLLAPQNTFLDTIATRFDGTHSNFVLGNAQVDRDYPIVYCSDGFCELTGFARAEVMQKSCACKFLYGPDTTIEKITLIETSLESKEELKTEALFRKKDLTPFWCLLDIVPIKNEKGEVVLFLASHKDITKTKMASLDEDGRKDGDDDDDQGSYDDDDEGSENNYLNDLPSNYNYNRRRSRAVLYHLSGHLKEQEKKKKRKLKINSGLLPPKSTVLPEYKVAAMKKSRFIVLHYSIMKSVWDWCVLLATLYIAIVVPFNAAVQNAKETLMVLTILDVTIEVIFILDVGINFRTTYVSKSGKVVYEARAIAINYLRSWFFIDLLAAVPFDLLILTLKLQQLDTIQLIKLARLLRLLRLLNKIERYSQYSAIVLTFFMLAFALLAHWLACIWFVIGRQELKRNEEGWDLGWINELGDQLKTPVHNRSLPYNDSIYITALYYTLSSLTSVGFGNVSANTNTEKIFTILVMFLGALCHAAVFGNVTAIIQRMYSRRALYHTKLRDLKDFVRSHHIPPALKTRMQEYFMTSWSINMGIDTTEMLQTFPEELRADIAMHLHKEFLALPIFADASQGCLRSLSLRIKTSFCAPGEYIVHQGDALNVIYFLLNGSMEILRHGMVVAILGKGDLFGCDLYVTDTVIQSSGDIHALTYCDLQSVTRHELLEVLSSYPEYHNKFQQEISRDLTFNLREGYDSEKYSYCETNNSGRNTRLTSISEVRDEEEVGTSKQMKDSSTDTGEDNMENRHMLLEVSNSVATSVPPDLSPRIVDGVEDEGSQFKRHSFDFPASRSTVHPSATRHRSLTLAPRQPLVGESRMRQSYTAPQLSNDQTTRSNSSDSLYQEDLRHELEYTRNSVERLDKQVSNLSRDVSHLSQDLRAVVKLLQVISPLASSAAQQGTNVAGASASSVNGPATLGLPPPPPPPTTPCVMTVKIGQGGEEDIIHVQRQDGVLETSLGGGMPELPEGAMGPTVAALTSAAMASASSNSASASSTLERPSRRGSGGGAAGGSTDKDDASSSAASVRQTSLVLFHGPDGNMVESISMERLDYDSENGTDL
ncbi:voltage-gated delayed rectifier potassium channel KCNH8-like [Diadema antillarum]|uniref:voltage-gated delayed rectifier potassium channel KCNH8-like n=1 Tax=Diadema antillarum TaxID=105358 RepID=UPI003A8C24C4